MTNERNDDLSQIQMLRALANPSSLPAPTPVPRLERALVLAQHEELAARERSLDQAKQARQRREFVGPFKPWSNNRLDELQVAEGINALQCDTSAKGYVLVVKIISSTCVRSVPIHLVVEDVQGQVAPLQVHHIPRLSQRDLDDRFPPGAVFAVKEPTLRSGQHGFLIRIDSPVDFVPLYPSSPLYCFPCGSTAPADRKVRGNSYFTKDRYEAALRTYTAGIESTSVDDDPELLATLLSNRAITLLKLNRPASALADTVRGLELSLALPEETDAAPLRKKLLYRQALAHYARDDWAAAASITNQLVSTDPSDSSVIALHERIRRRKEENDVGEYNWPDLFARARQGKMLDLATYPHRTISLVEVEGKGIGVVATERVERGELILVENSIAGAASTPSGDQFASTVGMNLWTELIDPQATREVVSKLIEKMDDDEKVRRLVLALCTGPVDRELDDVSDVGVDVSRLEAIVTFNSFRVDCLAQMSITGERNESEDPPSALYNVASSFNHACIGNVSYQTLSHVITVRATRTIEAGEELVAPYIDASQPLSERIKRLLKHGFVCKCELCELDRRDPPEGVERRAALKAELGRSGGSILELERFVRYFDETYDPIRTKFRLESFRPKKMLAEAYARAGRWKDAIAAEKSALEALGAEFSGNGDDDEFVAFPRADSSTVVQMALSISSRYSSEGDVNGARRWIERAKQIEEGEAGRELFELRYGAWCARMGVNMKP